MEKGLYEKLKKYGDSDFYPFHMPGHKRNTFFAAGFPQMEIDITEIDGFDNLHHPESILKELQEEISSFYQVKNTYLSVNGSTAGLLAAISACVPNGGKIAIARNCHKAVYHAIYLRNLKPYYIYPQFDLKSGLNGGISAKDVDNLLKREKDIQAVLITSPTYDGILSDVREISHIVHKYNIPLIVDEAHGAHFIFSKYFPESAITFGADLVIQSVHKTLPALTQTSLLHAVTNRVDQKKISFFMGIYQSSSPSYVLMSSIDYCFQFLKENGETAFEQYISNLQQTRQRLEKLKKLEIITEDIKGKNEIFDYDLSKIIISVKRCEISGHELHKLLREKYHLEMEMETESYVLALSSIGDTKEGFERLARALEEIDEGLKLKTDRDINIDYLVHPEQVITPSETMDGILETIQVSESENRVAGEFVYLYPPGIPLLVPGELITSKIIENMRNYQKLGLNLQGLSDYSGNTIKVKSRKEKDGKNILYNGKECFR